MADRDPQWGPHLDLITSTKAPSPNAVTLRSWGSGLPQINLRTQTNQRGQR